MHTHSRVRATHVALQDGLVLCAACATDDRFAGEAVMAIDAHATPFIRSCLLDLLKVARNTERELGRRVKAVTADADAAVAAGVQTATELGQFFTQLARAVEAQRGVMEKVLAFEQKSALKVRWALAAVGAGLSAPRSNKY